jgi:hypothetical protein
MQRQIRKIISSEAIHGSGTMIAIQCTLLKEKSQRER